MTTATAKHRPPATALLFAKDDATASLLERLWQEQGPQAVDGMNKSIATIDRWLRRENPGEPGPGANYGWAQDPQALLIARHDAVARRDWLEARASGLDPKPVTSIEPSAEELIDHLVDAIRFRVAGRIVNALLHASEELEVMLGHVRADLANRLGVYAGDVAGLSESWAQNESSIARLAALEQELVSRIERIAAAAPGIQSGFQACSRPTLEGLGLQAIALGLVKARGLDDRRPLTNPAIENARYRLGNLDRDVANISFGSRETAKAAMRAEIEAEIEDEVRWIKVASEQATDATAATLEAEIVNACDDPSRWAAIGEAIAAHPEAFPADAAARWLEPVAASLEGASPAVLVEAIPYL